MPQFHQLSTVCFPIPWHEETNQQVRSSPIMTYHVQFTNPHDNLRENTAILPYLSLISWIRSHEFFCRDSPSSMLGLMPRFGHLEVHDNTTKWNVEKTVLEMLAVCKSSSQYDESCIPDFQRIVRTGVSCGYRNQLHSNKSAKWISTHLTSADNMSVFSGFSDPSLGINDQRDQEFVIIQERIFHDTP